MKIKETVSKCSFATKALNNTKVVIILIANLALCLCVFVAIILSHTFETVSN